MICPKCGKEMWDNRKKKLSPKAPDFKCKDENCRYARNPDTEEWEESEYQTGVWVSKEISKPVSNPSIKSTPSGFQPDMRLAYRKDLMVALINAYPSLNNQELKGLFNDLWQEVEK
jgi:hypothetical protein